MLPFAGFDSKTNVKGSWSTSLPVIVITIASSSSVVEDIPTSAIGASFTDKTVTLMVCESVNSPSVAVIVNISLP